MNKIIVEYGCVTQLAKICGCTIQSVRLALKGVVKSDLATKIRNEAIKLGGVEIKPKVIKVKE